MLDYEFELKGVHNIDTEKKRLGKGYVQLRRELEDRTRFRVNASPTNYSEERTDRPGFYQIEVELRKPTADPRYIFKALGRNVNFKKAKNGWDVYGSSADKAQKLWDAEGGYQTLQNVPHRHVFSLSFDPTEGKSACCSV
jgi:hypothetical protein